MFAVAIVLTEHGCDSGLITHLDRSNDYACALLLCLSKYAKAYTCLHDTEPVVGTRDSTKGDCGRGCIGIW